LLQAARQRAQGRAVRTLVVQAGALHRYDRDVMQQALTMLADGTEIAGADLQLRIVNATHTCDDCAAVAEAPERLPVCPSCHSTNIRVTGGDEFILESLEYEPTVVN
jgi:hydrogenase nickel incorporation protein HypA/HybF